MRSSGGAGRSRRPARATNRAPGGREVGDRTEARWELRIFAVLWAAVGWTAHEAVTDLVAATVPVATAPAAAGSARYVGAEGTDRADVTRADVTRADDTPRPDGTAAPGDLSELRRGRAAHDVASGSSWGQHAPRTRAADATSAAPRAASRTFRPNEVTDATPDIYLPELPPTSHVDPLALLVGRVVLADRVLVGPFASVRADQGQPIYVGADSTLEDGVIVHGLPTYGDGRPIAQNRYEVDGRSYSVYVGERVTLEHQAQLHGPVWIEGDTWVGMQALIAGAHIERGAVIEPGAKVLGVRVPRECYVPAGVVVDRQDIADRLPEITPSYRLRHRNRASLHVSRQQLDAKLRLAPHEASPAAPR